MVSASARRRFAEVRFLMTSAVHKTAPSHRASGLRDSSVLARVPDRHKEVDLLIGRPVEDVPYGRLCPHWCGGKGNLRSSSSRAKSRDGLPVQRYAMHISAFQLQYHRTAQRSSVPDGYLTDYHRVNYRSLGTYNSPVVGSTLCDCFIITMR